MRKPAIHCTRWLSTNGKGAGVVATLLEHSKSHSLGRDWEYRELSLMSWQAASSLTSKSSTCGDRTAQPEASASSLSLAQTTRGTRYDSSTDITETHTGLNASTELHNEVLNSKLEKDLNAYHDQQ